MTSEEFCTSERNRSSLARSAASAALRSSTSAVRACQARAKSERTRCRSDRASATATSNTRLLKPTSSRSELALASSVPVSAPKSSCSSRSYSSLSAMFSRRNTGRILATWRWRLAWVGLAAALAMAWSIRSRSAWTFRSVSSIRGSSWPRPSSWLSCWPSRPRRTLAPWTSRLLGSSSTLALSSAVSCRTLTRKPSRYDVCRKMSVLRDTST
jgi:hypothetical protein